MAYRKNQTNAQIVPLALRGIEGETATGNMSTESRARLGYAGSRGHMPKSWSRLYGERARVRAVLTVIYSYNTPIAWLDRDHGWIIPNVTYSATTSSKHQTHLWKLGGRTIDAPRDATGDDMRRVLSGELVFTSKGYGSNRAFTGTIPGPNYIPEV